MISKVKSVTRKTVLWFLRKLNPGDIHIRHHYTGTRITIDAFKHKGYWFHGKRRESATMQLLARIVKPGDTVLEAGGNVGYISVYLGSLCEPTGRVFVFEPDATNLRYLRLNVAEAPNVEIVEKAVASTSGPRTLYVEALTGQNNSFYSDYDVFKKNAEVAGYDGGGYAAVEVDAVTIDDFCRERNVRVGFVKIDIEGAELEALQGMDQTAERDHPPMLVEVTRNKAEVFSWLADRGYRLFSEKLEPIHEPGQFDFNAFCFHSSHQSLLNELGLNKA